MWAISQIQEFCPQWSHKILLAMYFRNIFIGFFPQFSENGDSFNR
jgi:hypothetical protein